MSTTAWIVMGIYVVVAVALFAVMIAAVGGILEARRRRRLHRDLVRALTSVLQATTNPEDRKKQLRSHFANSQKPSGTPVLPVLLEKLVLERDSLGPAGFKERYGVDVSIELRNELHAVAENLDDHLGYANVRDAQQTDHPDSRDSPESARSPGHDSTLRETARQSIDVDEKRHRQTMAQGWWSLAATVVVGIAAIIVGIVVGT